jgi:tetratricopeptide (TPR) repeat protein
MRETGTSISEYLKSKSESWISLHKEEAARPDAYYSNGDLVTTWLVSYKEIQRKSPSAARLLLLLAYYDNQDIWYDLIHNALKNERETGPSWLFEVASSRAKFSRAIRFLLHFSFVQSKPYLSSYSLHPVVHDWCRAYIKGKDIEKEAVRIAILSVGFSCVFSHQREYWISQQRLLPHANRMLEFLKDSQSSFRDPIILNAVKYLGMLYRDQCKLGNAEQLLEWALTGGEAIGLDVTPVMNSLAVIYEQLGRLEQSEVMLRRALTGKDVLVSDDQIRLRVIDATTLNTVNSLGYLCRIRGKLHQAEMMFCQVLAGREELLGLDHPLTVAAMDNVASVYLDQGKLQQAEKLYQEALTRKRNLLGSDHPDTLITINNIGDLYLTQGKLEKAEDMFQQALTGREKAVGPHRLNTTRTLNGLASLYQEQGRLEQAEEMFQRALVICEEVLGTNHPDTLTVISNLGVLYWKLGRLQQAEEMWQRALAGYEKVLGPDHHKTRQVVTALNLHCNKGLLYSTYISS